MTERTAEPSLFDLETEPAESGPATSREATSVYAADGRPVIAVDWSVRAVHCTTDGDAVRVHVDLDALLDTLAEPHKIALESTFESWDPARRSRLVERARAEGHEVYVYRPIHTARIRPEDEHKSDSNDARLIHQIATGGRLHLYPYRETDRDWVARYAAINAEYQRARLSGEKARFAERAAAVLGPYRSLDDEARLVLGNGKQYSEALLAAMYLAVLRTGSRTEFERLLGLHGSAHPGLMRSDVHHHSFRWARRRGATWQQYRRQVRRARTTLAAALRNGECADDSAPDAGERGHSSRAR